MFNRELAQVQRFQLEITKEDLERTKVRIEAGVLTQADIFDIEANLASQEQALVQAENNYRLSLISLAQLLLITDYENFQIADEDFDIPFSDILSQKPKEIYEKALTIRNDIKLGVANIEVAKKDIEIAKGALMPSLTAFLQLQYPNLLFRSFRRNRKFNRNSYWICKGNRRICSNSIF